MTSTKKISISLGLALAIAVGLGAAQGLTPLATIKLSAWVLAISAGVIALGTALEQLIPKGIDQEKLIKGLRVTAVEPYSPRYGRGPLSIRVMLPHRTELLLSLVPGSRRWSQDIWALFKRLTSVRISGYQGITSRGRPIAAAEHYLASPEMRALWAFVGELDQRYRFHYFRLDGSSILLDLWPVGSRRIDEYPDRLEQLMQACARAAISAFRETA